MYADSISASYFADTFLVRVKTHNSNKLSKSAVFDCPAMCLYFKAPFLGYKCHYGSFGNDEVLFEIGSGNYFAFCN